MIPSIRAISFWLFISCLTVFAFVACQSTEAIQTHPLSSSLRAVTPPVELSLTTGWKIAPTIALSSSPAALSDPSSPSLEEDWRAEIELPSTILGALVKNGEYPDVYKDRNLEGVDTAQFRQPWVYLKEFKLSSQSGDFCNLVFEGVNYRANVWFNGSQIASADSMVGCYRTFDCDVTQNVIQGTNRIVVEVFPPQPGDFSLGFVDWAPTPPDKNMGIWRPVKLVNSGAVSLGKPFVKSKVNKETLSEAELTIEVPVQNRSDQDVKASFGFVMNQKERLTFSYDRVIKAGEQDTLVLTSIEIPLLDMKQVKLWWPVGYGSPVMNDLVTTVQVDSVLMDRNVVRFGIREVEEYFNEEGHKGFMVNGKKILIRGGGWVDDLLLNNTEDYNRTQMEYVRHMNLNTIRFEGFWGTTDEIYSMCDKYGILAMCGFSCQWEWNTYLGKKFDEGEDAFGGITEPHEKALVADYLHDQVLWLRNHPSIFVWVGGSDRLHAPDLEEMHLANLKRIDPTRPYLGAAKEKTSSVTGPTGVKMEGPYDFVTPNYWYTDTARGGAFGFNTETGPGPQPLAMEGIKRMLSPRNQWPIDNPTWMYHNGRHEFSTLDKFKKAFDARYGKAKSIEDFAFRAQAQSYEAMRPMFEAFTNNRPKTTGVIQWMLNSAWPETYWQLYDYFLQPNGAYYATRKACQPLNISYHYGDQGIYVSSTGIARLPNGKAVISLFDKNSILLQRDTLDHVKIAQDEVKRVFEIPKDLGVAFVDLRLRNVSQEIASNFYWLPITPDVIDPNYENSSWVHTPNTSFGDLTYLNDLPKTKVEVKLDKGYSNNRTFLKLKFKNSGTTISFFNEIKCVDKTSELPILPCPMDDNYFSLLPGEEKVINLRILDPDLKDQEPEVKLKGINSTFSWVDAPVSD